MKTRGRDELLVAAVRASAGDVLAYLERRVGRDEAEDLLSETMVVAWRRIADLPSEPERARMWLFGIARTTLLNQARASGRRQSLAERIRTQPKQLADPSADDGLEVRDAISRLAPELAEIVRLVHWERLALVEVAQLLRISDSTVRSRYARAKALLRTALQPGADSGVIDDSGHRFTNSAAGERRGTPNPA